MNQFLAPEEKGVTIIQTGERVALGKYLELLIQQLFLGDVTKRHNDRLAEFRVMIQDKTEADIVDQALDVDMGFESAF